MIPSLNFLFNFGKLIQISPLLQALGLSFFFLHGGRSPLGLCSDVHLSSSLQIFIKKWLMKSECRAFDSINYEE